MISVILKYLSNTLPAGVACFLFVLAVVMLSQVGLSIFNKWRLNMKTTANNEVAGIVFGAISLIYSLILAFVIVAVWEDYEDLAKTIQAESDKMNGIVAHTSMMPDSIRVPIYKALNTYCEKVVQDEWHMESENLSSQSSAIPCLRLMLLTKKPQDELQRNVFAVIDNELSQITELRRNRLTHNHSQIPDLVWLILQSGTILLIVFFYFFQLNSMLLKRIYLSFFSGSLAMCLFLVASLDHPFDPRMQMSKAPYLSIQQELLKDNKIICN